MSNATEGRLEMFPDETRVVERVPGATIKEAISAFTTDLARRASEGELDYVMIVARDEMTGSIIEYRL